MKILVTGGTGFVGPKIVHALRAHERADITSFCSQRMHDPRADEARRTGDEDLHDSKFCQ